MATKKRYKLGTALAKLSSEKLTGTLICVNEQNLQGSVFVKAGRIVKARCHNHTGRDAIEVIQKYPLTSLKFHNNKNLISPEEDRQESTAATKVGKVKGRTKNQKTVAAHHKLLPDVLSMAQLQSDRFEEPISAEILEILTEELIEQLGPLADILVSELPGDINLSEAITILSHDIDDQDLTIAFVDAIIARV